MRGWGVALVALAVAALAARAAAEEWSRVYEITPDNFSKYVGGDKPAVLFFYLDGCPHCQEFEPTFHSASRSEPHVVFGMVNAKYRDLLDRFNVDRFPTVEWVPALSTKAKVAYEGDRTVQDLRRWIRDDGFARDPVGKTQGPRMRHVAEEDRGVFKERPN